MQFSKPLAVRLSADHQSRIEVHYKDEKSEFYYDWMSEMGVQWYVKQPELRSLTGLPDVDFRLTGERYEFDRECRAALDAALKSGDPVLWVIFGEHSMYSFRFAESGEHPPRFSDSWLTGFVVINRRKWRKALPNVPCTKATCLKFLQENFEPVIEADLNGTVKECLFTNEEEGEGYWFGEFLTVEEALQAALEEHPECRYEESDFDVTVEYRLKKAA